MSMKWLFFFIFVFYVLKRIKATTVAMVQQMLSNCIILFTNYVARILSIQAH